MKKSIASLFLGLFAFVLVAKGDAVPFSRNLYFGLQKDPDVVRLQQFLTGEGFYSGPANGNFFSLTLAAVKAFQVIEGINPPAGYFGPASRARAYNLLSTSVAATSTPSSVSAMHVQLQTLLQQVVALRTQLQSKLQAEQAAQVAQVQTGQQNSITVTSTSATTTVSVVLQNPTSTSQYGMYQPSQHPQSTQTGFVTVMLGSDAACGNFIGGPAVNRSRMVVDNVSCLKLSAEPSGREVHMRSITLNFSGSALNGAGAFGVMLIDPQTQVAYDSSLQEICTPASGACSATFNFSGTPINAGQIKGIVAQINSANFSNSIGQNDGLDITLNSRSDITWDDGITTSGLPSDIGLPILLTHVAYE